MKLAFFTDSFHPELGGIQDSIATQARALAARGHRLVIFAPAPGRGDHRLSGLGPAEIDLGSGVTIARLPSIRLPGSTGQSRLAIGGAAWRERLTRFGPDLIHVHTFLSVGWLGRHAARRLGLPLIGTNHWAADGFGLYAPAAIEALAARRFMTAVARFYRRCAEVTTPSQATAEAMRRVGFDRPLVVVSNPIDCGLFSPVSAGQRQVLRQALGLIGPTVVYAGRLGIEKKVKVLIEAIARLADRHPGLTLALAGHGTERPALEGFVADLGLTGRVRFLGSLPHPVLADWLRASDVFAIASTSESQCMALLQAMACGRPAVVADSRALPEVLGPDAGLLARPDDPADFAANLDRLLSDPGRAGRCGEAARARAGLASIPAVTDQWEALYDSLIRRSPARDHHRHPGTQRGGLPRPLP